MIVIGHRGALGYEPENTLRSIQKAIEIGVDAIEFDVQLLKDGNLILMHDDTLDRTTNGEGFVAEKTLNEIKELDAGKGEKVPTLQEALNIIDRKIPVIIEITGFASPAEHVVKVIQDYVHNKGWKYTDFRVSSFIHSDLLIIKEMLPQIQIGANISAIPLSYAKFAEELGVDFIASENLYVTNSAFVQDAHKRGIKFYLFSLDNPKYIKRYQEFGIDGIFSNLPDKVK